MKKFSSATAWIVVLIVVIFTALALANGGKTVNVISFDKFQTNWISNNVKSFQLKEDNITVDGVFKRQYNI